MSSPGWIAVKMGAPSPGGQSHSRYMGMMHLEIAEPCAVAWGEMSGTGAKRHCDHCEKTVHSLSDMDEASATDLLLDARATQQRVCVRVRCDGEGFVLFETPPEKRLGHPRLRLLLTPAMLSAGLMAACGAPTESAPAPSSTTNAASASSQAVAPKAAQAEPIDATATATGEPAFGVISKAEAQVAKGAARPTSSKNGNARKHQQRPAPTARDPLWDLPKDSPHAELLGNVGIYD